MLNPVIGRSKKNWQTQSLMSLGFGHGHSKGLPFAKAPRVKSKKYLERDSNTTYKKTKQYLIDELV